jgi:hypothetical protein
MLQRRQHDLRTASSIAGVLLTSKCLCAQRRRSAPISALAPHCGTPHSCMRSASAWAARPSSVAQRSTAQRNTAQRGTARRTAERRDAAPLAQSLRSAACRPRRARGRCSAVRHCEGSLAAQVQQRARILTQYATGAGTAACDMRRERRLSVAALCVGGRRAREGRAALSERGQAAHVMAHARPLVLPPASTALRGHCVLLLRLPPARAWRGSERPTDLDGLCRVRNGSRLS